MSCTSVNIIQGPQGSTGTSGTSGVNGINSFTTLTAAFTMPAEGSNGTATVGNTAAFASGQWVWMQGGGFLQVQTIVNSTQMTLKNLRNAAKLQYQGNVAPGVVVASGNLIATAGPQGPGSSQYFALYQDQRLTTVNSTAFTSGSWVTVPINTQVLDTGQVATLNAGPNSLSLIAGTYRCRWRVVGYKVGNFQSRLYNSTLGTVIAYGSNAASDAAGVDMDYSEGEYRFTFGVSYDILLQARCQTTNATGGFGIANSFGGPEVYSSIELDLEYAT